jgi:hypothetical protein
VEFRERLGTLAREWVAFLEGAAKFEKKLPHGTIIVQVSQHESRPSPPPSYPTY